MMVTRAGGDYVRRMSYSERYYLAADQLRPGFGYSIQLVFEGEGSLSLEQLQAAVAHAAEANPGCRLILRGVLGWSRWVAVGPAPSTRVVDNWTTDEPPPREIERPLSPQHGPTCEVILAPSPRPRIIFRCFHGIMDAHGLVCFAEEVFRALRGEPLTGYPCTLSDTEVVKSLVGNRTRPTWKSDYLPIAGAPSSRERDLLWKRLSLEGPVPALVAKVSAALARHARRHHGEHSRIMIPVDVRNYKKDIRAMGNMSYPLFIDITSEESWQEIHKMLLKRLAAREALRLDPIEDVLPWIPMRLFRTAHSLWTAGHWRTGRFPVSALVSHLAVPSTAPFSGGGFHCRSLYYLPVRDDFLPLSVSVVSSADTVEIVVAAPSALVDGGRLEQVCEAIERGVVADSAT